MGGGGGVQARGAWGFVAAKILAMKLTLDDQVEGVNFDPLEMTKLETVHSRTGQLLVVYKKEKTFVEIRQNRVF
jgi:hypothetical protein